MNITNDNLDYCKKRHKISILILNIKAHSVPYVIKTFIFTIIVAIILIISDTFETKILSMLTYIASISLDSFFIIKQNIKNKELEAFCVLHLFIMIASTLFILFLLIINFYTENFQSSVWFSALNTLSNIIVIYATLTPILEVFIHCDESNQFESDLVKKDEVEK